MRAGKNSRLLLTSLCCAAAILILLACGSSSPSGPGGGTPPVATAPSITTPPANQTVTAGQTASFTVTATGTDPLAYQWRKNGADIPGATTRAYTTPPTTAGDDGSLFSVRVSNAAGQALSAGALLTVTVPPPTPILSGFLPASGPVGTAVVISGSHFTGATLVAFHGTPSTSFTVDSDGQITAAVPAGASSGVISVTTPGGTISSSAAFAVVVVPPPAPSVSGFLPASGPVGTVVVISGSHFSGATAVAFHGTPSTSFSVNSDGQISAAVPSGASSGVISITTPGGSADSSSAFTVSAGTSVHVPLVWQARGVGGGGAMYGPTISPLNSDHCYLSSDMGDVFFTSDFGNSYATVPATQIVGGHYSAIRFTSDPNILYSLTYANGNYAQLVKSLDGGATWNLLPGDPLPGDDKWSIWADPSRSDRVILSGYSDIYSSTDGGASFKDIYTHPSSGPNPDNGVVVGGVFFDGDHVYLGTSDGLLVSSNGGTSFSNAGSPGIPTTEAIASFAGARVGAKMRFFALTGAAANTYPLNDPGGEYYGYLVGIYSLEDGAGSWTSRMTGINAGSDYLQYVAMALNDVSTVYAAGSDGNTGAPEVMTTVDAGAHWAPSFRSAGNQNIATGWSGEGGDRGWGFGEVVYGLGVAPFDSSRAYITDMGFAHRTRDTGASWEQAYVATADEHPAGSTSNAAKSYHSVGLENTSCYQVTWSDAQHVFASFTDIEGIRSVDGGASWSLDHPGLAANTTYWIVRDPTTGTLYAATSDIHDMYQSYRLAANPLDNADAHGDILMSTDKGATWSKLHSFGHPVFWLAQDPNTPHRMYASVEHSTLGGVFVTENLQSGASSTWTKLPLPPRAVGHPATLVVLSDGQLLATFSGQRTNSGFTNSSGLFLWNPASSAWSDLSDPGMHYWTKDVVLDSSDAAQNTWLVGVFSGWGGAPNDLGGLYRSTDRGAHWSRIFAQDSVTSVTLHPLDPDQAYVTTENQSLWYTSQIHTASPVFTQVTGYPFMHPERVFFNPFAPADLWVASFGNGLKVGTTQ